MKHNILHFLYKFFKNFYFLKIFIFIFLFSLNFLSLSSKAALTTNLSAFWNLNDTTGSRLDSIGSNTLTNNATVTATSGIISNASLFSGTNYLSISDNTALSTGDIDFTVSGWVYITNKTANRTILSKFDSTVANQREYALTYNSASDRFNFIVSNDGTSSTILNADNLGSPSLNTWYYVVAWHDSVNNTINIQVNNGAINSSSYSLGVFNGTAAFIIGATNSGAANQMIGRVDNVGLWKRVLTVNERNIFYNSGAGIEYPFATPSAPTSLSATASSTQVSLSWTAPAATSGVSTLDYIIEYKLTSEPTIWTTFSDGTSTATTVVVTGLTNGLQYDFRVSAVNVARQGAVSSTATSTPFTLTVPSAPLGFNIKVGATSADLFWTTPSSNGGSSIIDYLIEYKLSSSGTWLTFNDSTSTATTTSVTGLSALSSYDFRVSAVNSVGTGSSTSLTNLTLLLLSNSVAGFWALNETSGTRADSVGSNTLTNNSSVGFAAGKINNAALFSGSNYLSISDNPSVSTGDIDFTVAGWVYLSDKTANRVIVSKWDSSTTSREYDLIYVTGTDRFFFTTSSNGTTVEGNLSASTFGSPSLNTWYYVVAWHDSVNNTINIQVNNGAIDSASVSAGVFDGSTSLIIGAANHGTASFMNGRVDGVGLWKRVLTASDRTTLYNSGNGYEYPFGANSILINSPKSYQVIQRNGSNQATINISGTYAGSPTAIEASWNGGAYTTIVASPTGGSYSGSLTNQTAGQGTLSVRFTNDTSAIATKSYVGIGDIFVIAGQSNAEGYADNNQVYTHATLKATMFANDDNWKELTDPTDINTNQVDIVSDDSTAKGSVWPVLATHFMAEQNVPVAFIPTARGGSIIRQWQKNSSSAITNTDTTSYSSCSTTLDTTGLYGSMYRRINAVGGSVKAVLFHQGETDTQNSLSQANYYSYLKCFTDNVYADFGVSTVVAQIGPDDRVISNDTSMNGVRAAQRQLWDEGENNLNHILVGPTTYNIPVADPPDGVHFVTNAALQTLSDRWWSALKKHFYGGNDARGPRLTSATYNTAKTVLTLTFTDESLPILATSTIGGFSVRDNGNVISVSSISKINDNQIRINLTSAATGTLTVSLGYGKTSTYNTVNIPTDSSTYNLPVEFFADQATTLADIPSSPTSLIATSSNSQASLSWAAPSSNGGSLITDYLIEYKKSIDISWTTFTHLPSISTTATITGLTSATSYDFRVSAINVIGTSSSTNITASTTVEILISTPQIISNIGAVIFPFCFYNNTCNTTINTNSTSSTSTSSTSTPKKDLKIGSYDNDVKLLQIFLNKNGYTISKSGAGSKGKETTYFGILTKNALIKYQKAKKMKQTGMLDLETRGKMGMK